MTTLAELIAVTRWPEINAALAWLYPDEKERAAEYRAVLQTLRTLPPAAVSMRIAIEPAPRVDEVDETCMEVIGRDGTLNRELQEFGCWDERAKAERGDVECTWCLAFHPWREWLGMIIEQATLEVHSPAQVVAHCLYEMTFHGFHEDDIKDELRELHRRVEEIEGMSDEERAEKLIPLEQVMAELEQRMDD